MQVLVLLPDEPIALAGSLQQASSVENAYATPTVADQRIRLKLERRLGNAHATHTEKARHQGIEGTVVLTIVVDATGNVTDVKVVQALDPGLDDSAARTVRTWKFQPATRGGKPVAVGIRVEVSFGLYHQPR